MPGKPFTLVGSVRGDGHLRDVITDVIEGQWARPHNGVG
jgi:hypothetical protein